MMRSSLAILSIWICLSVDATFPKVCSELPKVDFAQVLPAFIKTSYSHGDRVKYTCKTGYVSLWEHIFECNENRWTKTRDATCTPVKCPPIHTEWDVIASGKTEGRGYGDVIQFDCKSPDKFIDGSSSITCKETGEWSASVPKCKDISCKPPDIRHGTVKQMREHRKDETLQYYCDPGYKPREGTPKCTKQGWSLEPKCEAESQVWKCPPIHTEGDVTASGKTEGGGYGDVIQFDCKSDKSIDGSSSIYCKETGEWSASVPNCKDISCTPPDIQHGSVKQKKEHKKDETLQYDCDPGYKPRQGNPKCTKQGWSLEPKCEAESKVWKCPPIHTEGDVTASGKTEGGGYGDVIQFDCKSDKSIDGSSSIYCKETGEWSASVPNCKDISCTPPDIQHGSVKQKKEHKKDETLQYDCDPGYKPRQGNPKCTKQGWSLEPKCEAESQDISCTPPDIQHGTVKQKKEHKKDETLQYDCDPGYKPRQGNPKCTKQGWSLEPKCEAESQEKKESCSTPAIENGYIHTNRSKKRDFYYSCNPGYKPYTGNCWKPATCVNGIWMNVPRCIMDDNSCVSPPNVDNALIISEPQTVYSSGSVVNYKCLTDFTMSGNNRIECRNAKWEKAPTCEAFCSKPHQEVNNAKLIDKIRGERKYSHGDTARYECDEDHESNGPTIAKCYAQTWIYPECTKKGQCTKPTMNLPFVNLLDEKNTFNNLEVLRYKCDKPYDKKPNGVLICKDGKWDGTFDCTSGVCPAPPMIEHGDFKVEQKTGEVVTSVSYTCQPYFELNKQQRYYRCLNGKWETPPACLKPCKITPEICKEHNIKPVQDDHMRHSDNDFKLHCNDGWNVGGFLGHSHSKAWCKDGELKIESKCTVRNRRD
nr:complement factor H-like isoform X2 [Misgurnus anguillicaudatus]